MSFKLYNLTPESGELIQKYSNLRTIKTCEGQFISQFIWADFYKTKYYLADNFIFFILNINDGISTCMPLCSLEDIEETFKFMQLFFNTQLNTKLRMYLADDIFLNEVKKIADFEANYDVYECREYFDYIYDAESLRTLKGKKLHKKKNHLNYFLREYKDRYEYKNLTCENTEDVKEFYNNWHEAKESNDSLNRLEDEAKGIYNILNNCNKLDVNIGGVYIDGKLQAFTIGSYSENLNRAIIHIEKANPEIRGLYNFVNQQFIIHSFPNVTTVNREDDMGLEGLRQAKMSYNPISLVTKYNIFQK